MPSIFMTTAYSTQVFRDHVSKNPTVLGVYDKPIDKTRLEQIINLHFPK